MKNLKKKEKVREKEREKEKERLQIMTQVATNWRRKKMLTHAMAAFKRLLSDSRLKEFVADKFRETTNYKRCLSAWINFKVNSELESRRKGDELYTKSLKTKCLQAWKDASRISIRKNQSAHDLHEFKLALRSFESWRNLTKQSASRELKLSRKASLFYKGMLLRRFWFKWLKIVSEKDVIRARDEMRKRLEDKIALEVNDYMPSRLREV